MQRTRVKICGITNVKDALLAAQLGADAIGLNFYSQSSRCITIEQASEIISALPPYLTVVALFVNAAPAQINEALKKLSIDLLQFHDNETAEECEQYHKPYVKALRITVGMDIAKQAAKFKTAQGILCDAYHPAKPGGTGETFDWKLVPKSLKKPIILAGGLNPANIKEAIQTVKPYAVDVTSGVEQTLGIKDPQKLQKFMENVRYADEQSNKI